MTHDRYSQTTSLAAERVIEPFVEIVRGNRRSDNFVSEKATVREGVTVAMDVGLMFGSRDIREAWTISSEVVQFQDNTSTGSDITDPFLFCFLAIGGLDRKGL